MARQSNRSDCYEYVRGYYRVPAYVGVRVRLRDREGVLVAPKCSDQYLHVKWDGGAKVTGPYHPLDGFTFLIEPQAVAKDREAGCTTADPLRADGENL